MDLLGLLLYGILHSKDEKYCCLRPVSCHLHPVMFANPDGLNLFILVHVLQDEDDQSCVTAENVKTKIYVYEYHIIYSASYSVPVLYFNVHKSGM